MSIADVANVVKSFCESIAILVGGLWAAFTFHRLQKTRHAEVEIQQTRANTELARANIERSRADTEKSRAQTEQSRADTEKSRADTEKSRADTDKSRAETEKVVADTQKSLVETDKALKESQKLLADTRKAAAEIAEFDNRRLAQQPNLEIQLEVAQYQDGDQHTYVAASVQLCNSGSQNLVVNFDHAALTVGKYDANDRSLTRLSNIRQTGPRHLSDDARMASVEYRLFRVGQRRKMVFLAPAQTPGLYLVQFECEYHKVGFEGEELELRERPMTIRASEQHLLAVTAAHVG